jgi:aspartate kinase
MIVMKFGGTSSEDATAMSNVIRLVTSHLADQPVVVISAIARATNELEATARAAASGQESEALRILEGLFNRHNTIINDLIVTPHRAKELKLVLAGHLEELRKLVRGAAILRELTPRTMDAICAHGERLSSRLVAAGLEESNVKAVWLDAKDFMVTDDNFGRAQPLQDIVEERLEGLVRPLLESGHVPVTQGFIGVTQSGSYTTMGRESSDYSASIIGAAMKAEKVQIWTDVDGILTADPTMVKSTRKLNRISAEEAFELSYAGAKVLHPNTMLPLLQKQIPVQILNSKRKGTGTLVTVNPGQGDDGPIVKSIAHRTNVRIISVQPYKRTGQYLFWESVFRILTRFSIEAGVTATSEYSIAFTVDGRADLNSLIKELSHLGTVRTLEKKATICLVGKGIRKASGMAGKVFSTLSSINVYFVSCGASETSMTVVVDEDQLEEALNRLHEEFFMGRVGHEIFEARVY